VTLAPAPPLAGEPVPTPPAHRRARLGRVRHLALDLLLVVAIGVLTWHVGTYARAAAGFPKGYDALGHFSTIQLILRNFPHFAWNYAWYGGMPAFPGSYPPLYSLLVAAGVAATGTSIPHAMAIAAGVIYVIATASCYGFVRVVGRSRLAAVLASLILVAAPTIWAQSLMNGLYPRLSAMAFGDLATFFAALHARSGRRRSLVATAIALAAALACHPVVGIIEAAQVFAVLLALPRWSFERRLRHLLGTAAIVAGLSAWFYLPYFVRFVSTGAYYLGHTLHALLPSVGIPYQALVWPTKQVPLAALSPLMLPAVAAVTLVSLALVRRPRRDRQLPLAAVVERRWMRRRQALAPTLAASAALALPALGCLFYALIGHFAHVSLYVNGIGTIDILAYAAWPLAAIVGVQLAGLLRLPARHKAPARALAAVLGVGTLATMAVVLPLLPKSHVDLNGPDQRALIDILPPVSGQRQYRVAGTIDPVTDWINAYTGAPENRGYFNQGILHLNDQVWMEDALADPAESASLRRFLVNWYAIRWLYAGSGPAAWSAYQGNPSRYTELAQTAVGPPYRTYEVRGAEPILSAEAAPSVLVVGPRIAYEYVMRTIAHAAAGPRSVVPIEGPPDLADLTLSDLERFPDVMLYGATIPDPAKAARLLGAYVRQGGRLVVEAVGDASALDAMAGLDPKLFPAGGWSANQVSRQWDFEPTPKDALLTGVALSRFGPPAYQHDQPWTTEVATALQRSAHVALETHHLALVVSSRDGAGQVVVDGLNLPYHAAVTRAHADGVLLANLLGLDLGHRSSPAPATTRFPSADEAQITLQSPTATEVVLKEDDFPDWHATLDGRPVQIWPAGPGMMAVLLPNHRRGPITVTFRYQLSAMEWGSAGISLATVAAVVLFGLGFPWAWLRRRVRRLLQQADLLT
jgi:hypothetical protein